MASSSPALTRRVRRLEATGDIKRLQHRYGRYLAEGRWAEAAGLFDPDGTLEVGLDGVMCGRAQIQEYLRATLAPTHARTRSVHAHLQIMPVITVAADALSARATWRELGTGGGGIPAYWSEGPQENSYVHRDGRWQIASLRWFRAFHVPYVGGWQVHSSAPPSVPLQPSAPPTDRYDTWPGVHTPAFHFLESSSDLPDPDPNPLDDGGSGPEDMAALAPRIARLDACRAVENLHGMAGYYLDKGEWTAAAALFADDARLSLSEGVTLTGRSALRAFLERIGPEGPQPGRLFDTMHLQPEIEVSADARAARGRWRLFTQWALSGELHEWGIVTVDVEYRRTPHGWRITEAVVGDSAFTPYDDGWDRTLSETSALLARAHHAARGADHSADREAISADDVDRHPSAADASSAPSAADVYEASDLEQCLTRAEAAQEIERMQYTYGYLLATFGWDRLTELFSDEGSIEVALRGVYRGRASIRRSLELYGSQPQRGVLHNHMQFQPVISLSEDGETASLRARALSMMGEFGVSARWMGGTYENRFVREADGWKFRVDRVFNTYFAAYETGWKDLPSRTAPGVSETNPPDSAPTSHFEMYPGRNSVPFSFPDSRGA